jgi:DNA polymerase-3 subunit epsilon
MSAIPPLSEDKRTLGERAKNDAMMNIDRSVVAFELPTTGMPALAVLLEQARKKTMRVWAEQSPFDLKDLLKRRGYRWSDGSDGRPRSWYIDVDESKLDEEIAFLKTEIYLRDVEPRLQPLTALNRFSVRA